MIRSTYRGRVSAKEPPIIVQNYKGKDALKVYERCAKLLAARGYYPVSQSTSGGGFSAGHILMFGIAGLAARKDQVLTVTYRREG